MSHKRKRSRSDEEDNNVEQAAEDCGCNVGEVERVASAIGGGLLVYKGLKRGSLFGFAMAAFGAAGLYRAATGTCPLYKSLNINTNTDGQKLSSVAAQAKQMGSEVADQAKSLASDATDIAKSVASDAADAAKTFTDTTRNRISNAIGTK